MPGKISLPPIRTAVFSLEEVPLLDLIRSCGFLEVALASTVSRQDEIRQRFAGARVVRCAAILNNLSPDWMAATRFDAETLAIYRDHQDGLLSIFSRRELSGTMSLAQMRVWILDTLSLCHTLVRHAAPEFAFFHTIPHEPCEYAFYCVCKALDIRIGMTHVTTASYRAHFLGADIDDFHLPSPPAPELGDEYAAILARLTAPMLRLPDYTTEALRVAIPAPSRLRLATFGLANGAALLMRYPFHKLGLLRGVFQDANMPDGTIGFPKVTSYSKTVYRIRQTREIYRTLRFLMRHERADVEFKRWRYIYFPLHYQPEATTAPLGGVWENQFFLAKFLAANLPSGMKLLVREHPAQFLFKPRSAKPVVKNLVTRSVSFYEGILRLPNTLLISRGLDNTELIENSELVAVITGTAGLEAYARGKRVAVFGPGCWFKHLAGVHFVRSEADLANAVDTPPLPRAACVAHLEQMLRVFAANTFPLYQHQYLESTRELRPTAEFVARLAEFLGVPVASTG